MLKRIRYMLKIFHNIKYIPSIILKIKNWPTFCLNYAGITNTYGNVYYLRSGIKFVTKERVDVSTIAVIFIKNNYGMIPNDCIIVDIGANIGVFSVYAAMTAKNNIIYSYEPMIDNYDLLIKNIQINKLENKIHAYNQGISSKKGKRKLFLNDTLSHSMYSGNEERTHVEIDCISLKDVFINNSLDSIDILKIDCEGAEFEILYNIPDEYFDKIKEIRMEYHNQDNKKNNIRELTDFLRQKGKTVVFLRSDNDYSGNIWFK